MLGCRATLRRSHPRTETFCSKHCIRSVLAHSMLRLWWTLCHDSLLRRTTQALYYHCVLVDFDAARRTYGSLPKKVRMMPMWRRRGRGWVGPHLRCRLLVGMWVSMAASGGAMGVGVVCAG